MMMLVLLFLLSSFLIHANGEGEGEQMLLENGFSQVTVSDFQLQWKVEGDMLRVAAKAKTTGWIAVGFDPTQMMKDANIIVGYVENGEARIRDDYGNTTTSHQADLDAGGSSDVAELSGSEENGSTALSFVIPLVSGDDKDRALDPGKKYRVILAWGPDNSDDFDAYHAGRTGVDITL